jgi:hypothetical protein
MLGDWILTVLQERERRFHYGEHYQSYLINTIEGHHRLRAAVERRRLIEPRHIFPALVLSAVSSYALYWIPRIYHAVFIGYVWGLFLIVITTHIGNLI